MADSLENLATALALSEGAMISVLVCNRWIVPSISKHNLEDANTTSITIHDEPDWKKPLINYLKHGDLPDDRCHKTEVRRRASRFIYTRIYYIVNLLKAIINVAFMVKRQLKLYYELL